MKRKARKQKIEHGGDQRVPLRLGGRRRGAHSSFLTRPLFFLLGGFFLALIVGLNTPNFGPGTASAPVSPASTRSGNSPQHEDPSTGLVWGVSIGEELTWVWTQDRGPDGPYTETKTLNVPVGNHTEMQPVNWTEGDRWRFVITSFGTMHSTILGFLPAAYGNLTLNGVTGVNHCLFHRVRPVNLNWTQYAMNRSAVPDGFPPVYRSEIVRETEDIFEFKVIVNEEYKTPNPDKHGDDGDLYRYDKHRGILLHRENLEWPRSGGYYSTLDFIGPPYATTKASGPASVELLLWFLGLILLPITRRKSTMK